jgi:long-chain acyl-CoA synthetase
MMYATLGEMLTDAARKFGGKPLVIASDRTLSFDEVETLSSRMARALQDLGIRQNDRVTLWLENGWRWLVAYYAILKIGAVVNPANILLTPDEVRFFLEDCESKVLISSCEKAAALIELGLISIAVGDFELAPGQFQFDKFLEHSPNGIEFDPPVSLGQDSLAAIGYTSGTTGFPKGAMLSHRNILFNTAMTSLMHGRMPSDIVISALPCAHVYGNIVMNSAVACGMTLVLSSRFDEETALEAIQRHRATVFEGVPAMYMKMLNSPNIDNFDFSSLRICTVGGQTMPITQMELVELHFKCPLIELWGMTELGGLGVTHPHNGPKQLGSIGIPLPFMDAKIVDIHDSSKECLLDTTGELVVRGPVVMSGYLNDADATISSIDKDGWLRTGDLARRNSDGFIFIVDRTKEVIISGGYNVYPAEVERVIAQHPAVAMVAAAPLKDDILGQVVGAFVVTRHDATTTADEIIQHCRKHLAHYKVPKAVRFLPDLPRTSTGKILRRALAEIYGAAGAQDTERG